MRLGAVVATIVGGDEARQPTVGLRFGFGFVEMVERLVRILHRAEWPLDLALGARRCPPTVGAGGHVGYDLDAEAFHHALEHRRFRDRSVVEVERGPGYPGTDRLVALLGLGAIALNRKRSAVSTSSP